ncbi:MAG: glycosyltransferase family 39 protein [Caldilineaceae bacterium]|nr:glycosyltransferase family 39 protein [Caldilineaceae bacterium]
MKIIALNVARIIKAGWQQVTLPRPRHSDYWLWGGALLLQLFLLPGLPLIGQAAAILLLFGLLPGYLLVQLIIGPSTVPPTVAERWLYSIGAGYSFLTLTMLALSYLPSAIVQGQALLWFNGWLVFFLICYSLQQGARRSAPLSPAPSPAQPVDTGPDALPRPNRWLPTGILVLLLVGGLYRFVHLGYAEFQGDEARLALRAAEILQGYEGTLFVHKKGPVEILLPTIIYALTNHLTEASARLPFAVANFTAIFAMLLLGRRLFGPLAGWVAALVIALDGYLIAFGRVVQYQSMVLLTTLLLILILQRVSSTRMAAQTLTRYLGLGVLFFVTGLLAHYEVLLVGIPALFLLWQLVQRVGLWPLIRAALVPVGIGMLLLASFYLPFALYPEFSDTSAYLVDYRLGLGGLYNNLASFFQRTTLYSSTYYLLWLILGTLMALFQLYRRALPPVGRWLASALVLVGLAITIYRPAWFIVNGQDYTGLFFFWVLLSAWLWASQPAERLVWLWFGGILLIALFLTAIPNTHVYSFFIPWALLMGMISEQAWQRLRQWRALPLARGLAATGAAVLIVLFGFYEYQLFVYHGVEVLRTWPVNRPAGYWTTYAEPVEIAIFGFPLNNGWKAVAGLYAQGALTGPYATNTRDEIAEWYTRGYGNCPRDEPNYYILTNPVEPTLADETAELRNSLRADHQLFGTVVVEGQPGLEIYTRLPTDGPPQQFLLQPYAVLFDRKLSTPNFEQNGPIGKRTFANPLVARFGEQISLVGFRLEGPTALAGDPFTVTFYWQATTPVAEDYAVFVQLIDLTDLHKAGQRDGQPGCNDYPTTTWVPGTTIADRYDIPLAADVRPGVYSLLVGLVTPDGTRLPIYDTNGQPLGDALPVTTIEILP